MQNTKKYKPVVLVVMDGYGYRPEIKDNAIATAKKPNIDLLMKKYPWTVIDASGGAVGLPDGQMGNSEVGHMTIGAGKEIDTDLVKIGKAMMKGEFEQNSEIVKLFDHVKKYDSVLHIQGLLSPGGVHSHSEHLYAILRAAKNADVKKVAIHIFTDGRDTPPQSAGDYIEELENKIKEIGVGRIASISGRYFAMDRDKNWDRIKKTEDAMFECKGNVCTVKDPSVYVKELYKTGMTDEYIEPVVIPSPDGTYEKIGKNDSIFFFNFRADRAREISERILERTADENVCFVTMTEYESSMKCTVAFGGDNIETTLCGEISKAGLKQVHIAETEKFAHATYFLNGGNEKPYEGEEDVLIPSRKDVATHDQAPEMKAKEITDVAIEKIQAGVDFIFINYANADMVGHTANVPAIITAVEILDNEIGRLTNAVMEKGGVTLITSDHGNAEMNIDPITGAKHTSHTTDPVPVILTILGAKLALKGGLMDIAPTVLDLIGLKKPESMTGKSLISG